MKNSSILLVAVTAFLLVGSFAVQAAPKTAAAPALAGDPYDLILTYESNQSRVAWIAIETEIRTAAPEALKAIEAKLLAAMKNPKATADCKGWICRELRVAGSEASVAPLAALLADKDCSTLACITLCCLSSPKADEALQAAIGTLSGDAKAGVAQVLGSRGDVKAVALLIPLLNDPCPAVVSAGIHSLGQLGGANALAALQKMSAPPALVRERANSILLCADRLLGDGKAADASAVYHAIFKECQDTVIQTAALRGILLADKDHAAPVVLSVMKGTDSRLQLALAGLLRGADPKVICAVQEDLGSLSPVLQASVLSLATEKSALPQALAALASEDASVRAAAIAAVGRLGSAADIAALLAAAEKVPADAKLVATALSAMNDPKVNTDLIAMAGKAAPGQKGLLIGTLAQRNAVEAMPTFITIAAGCADAAAAGELGRAMSALGAAKDLGDMVKALVSSSAPAGRGALADAIGMVASRTSSQEQAADALVAAISTAPVDLKLVALPLLGRLGGEKSLKVVHAALGDADAKIKAAAVRALADWPDDSVAADLLKLAQAGKGSEAIIALRGYLRLAALPGKTRTADQTAEMFKQAAALASRQEEKTLLLAKLAEAPASAQTLELAVGYLDNAKLKTEAALAAVKVAEGLIASNPALARSTAQRVRKMDVSKAVNQQADAILAKTPKAGK